MKLSGVLPQELIAGTSPASIDLAEDREKWSALCNRLRIPQPPGGTAVDLQQALRVVERVEIEALGFDGMSRRSWRRAKQFGFADAQLGFLWDVDELAVRAARAAAGVVPSYKTVDTCAAEFGA